MPQVTEPEYISPYVVTTSGGLVLDRDVYTMPVGASTILQNFEPSVKGGYRRLDGTTKYSSVLVNGAVKVLGVSVFANGVLAVAGTAGTTTLQVTVGGISASSAIAMNKLDTAGWVVNESGVEDEANVTTTNVAIGLTIGGAVVTGTTADLDIIIEYVLVD
jgi:hypothetical protein